MSNWTDIAAAYDPAQDGAAVLVTVGRVKGSTPRDMGTNMLVTSSKSMGTIGGGRLEYLAIDAARNMLREDEKTAEILNVPLGPELAQCCGGHVDILLGKLAVEDAYNIFNQLNEENAILLSCWTASSCHRQIITADDSRIYLDQVIQSAIKRRLTSPGVEILSSGTEAETEFTLIQSLHESEFHLTLFGAGHVGKAVVRTLSQLPCTIDWVDERPNEFPDYIPTNVRKIVTESPISAIPGRPIGGYYLIMTHSHQLDLDICEALLKQRSDARYIGLIGSTTKKAKFYKRLATRGFSTANIDRITCPIGLPELEGKQPAEIALGVATDIMKRHRKSRYKGNSVQSEGLHGT
ncbi:xanthine dehydrogenase accessory protein XdhC [uncultured Sneathiella sp.]|uniref:xanthine dehydrogenase accessory protein XdhC n=1 Tax=uncultured Sneathiella sp. TaxID=879315 RepID=UPI0030DA726D|tara:strand:+ start:732 stop:1784 length:1053 start_codon:yes stop_codon:yes gene_type:complete